MWQSLSLLRGGLSLPSLLCPSPMEPRQEVRALVQPFVNVEAVVYNTVMDQGATFDRTFELFEADGITPMDLTGYLFAAQLRKKPQDTGAPVATFTCSLGLQTNQVNINLTDIQTGMIPLDASSTNPTATTRYYYDLELTAPDTTVLRLVQGYIDVSPEVTK